MRTIAGRWRLATSVPLPTPFVLTEIDFGACDFTNGVERVPWANPMTSGPNLYRVSREGIYLVTAALTVVVNVEGGTDIATARMRVFNKAGSQQFAENDRAESWHLFPPSSPSSLTFSTLVKLAEFESVAFAVMSDGESQLTGIDYWEGMWDTSWIEIVRVGDLRVLR